MNNNHKTLSVKVEYPFGRELIRPLCDTAKIFAKIAGTGTLTRHTIEQAKALGYVMDVVQDKVEL